MITQKIKDLAAEREKYISSLKVLKKLDNVSDVESVIKVLEDGIKNINEDLQKYIYCTNVDKEEIIKWLDEQLKFNMKQVESGDSILDHYVNNAMMFFRILNDLSTFYSLDERNDYEVKPEVIKSLQDEDHNEYLELLSEADMIPIDEYEDKLLQKRKYYNPAKDTDEDEDW